MGTKTRFEEEAKGNSEMAYYRYNGPFYDHFCTTTDIVDFQFATSECRQNNLKTTVVHIDLS